MLRVLPVLVAVLAISGCNIPRHHAQRTVKQSLETTPLTNLDLTTFNGDITVQTHSQPTVEVEITYHAYGETPEKAQSICLQMDTLIQANEGRLTMAATKPAGQWNSSVEFNILLPPDCQLKLKTSNGAVKVHGTQADVNIDTSNGAVTVENVAGNLIAHTSNGRIQATQIVGTVDLKSSNGKLEFSGALLEGDNKMQTSNGTVKVTLAADIPVDLEAKTSNGKIHCELTDYKEISKTKRSLHAQTTALDPIASLNVRSSNGSITLLQDTPQSAPTPTSIPATAEVTSSEIAQ